MLCLVLIAVAYLAVSSAEIDGNAPPRVYMQDVDLSSLYSSKVTCQRGYFHNTDKTKCYKFYADAKNWNVAETTCRNEKAYLAIPTSPSEASYLSSELAKQPFKFTPSVPFYMRYFFVGISKRGRCDWYDTFGRPMSFQILWGAGEPNDPNGLCMTLNRYEDGKLNDYYCDKPAVFFCEHQ